jgi:hypothetical protein
VLFVAVIISIEMGLTVMEGEVVRAIVRIGVAAVVMEVFIGKIPFVLVLVLVLGEMDNTSTNPEREDSTAEG